MPNDIKGTSQETFVGTLDDVNKALLLAHCYDMEPEVITTAMIFLKENPNVTIHDALKVGLINWDLNWTKI